jgi:isoprenylcysteine carboxyl methyltransferase (ICMT) family protein YpbQ
MINSDQKNNLHIQHTMLLEILDVLYFFSAAFFTQICHKTMGYTYFGTYLTQLSLLLVLIFVTYRFGNYCTWSTEVLMIFDSAVLYFVDHLVFQTVPSAQKLNLFLSGRKVGSLV